MRALIRMGTALFFGLAFSSHAHAVPVSLTLSTISQISYQGTVDLDSLGVIQSPLDTAALSGSLAAEIDHTGLGVPSGLAFTGSSIAAFDLEASFSLGVFGTAQFNMTQIELEVGTPGPSQPVTAGNFDLADHVVAVTDAFVGPGSGLLGGPLAFIYDFPDDPESHPFLPIAALTGTGTISETPTGNPGEYLVTVTIPLAASDTTNVDGINYTYDITGQVVATGTYVVPEPNGLVLAGLAVAGLLAIRRRIHR